MPQQWRPSPLWCTAAMPTHLYVILPIIAAIAVAVVNFNKMAIGLRLISRETQRQKRAHFVFHSILGWSFGVIRVLPNPPRGPLSWLDRSKECPYQSAASNTNHSPEGAPQGPTAHF